MPDNESVERNGSAKNTRESQLILMNDLQYMLPKDISLVVKRSKIEHFSGQNAYAGTAGRVITFDLSLGEGYTFGPHSYFKADLRIESPGNNIGAAVKLSVEKGSALNMIKRIVLTSASGQELDHWENINSFSHFHEYLTCSQEHINSMSSVMFHQRTPDAAAVGLGAGLTHLKTDTDDGGGSYIITQVIIPLSKLSGLFRQKTLIPPFMLAGSRLDITLEPVATAFKSATADMNYTLLNPALVLDEMFLIDSVSSIINNQSSNRGLDLDFQAVDYNKVDLQGGATQVVINSRRATVRTQKAFIKVREQQDQVLANDSMASRAFGFTEGQFVLGGLRYPVAPIQSSLGAAKGSGKEFYIHAIMAADAFKDFRSSVAMTYEQFLQSHGVVAVNLERSPQSLGESQTSNSALPISASRVLEFRGKHDAVHANGAQVDMFVIYKKILKAYLNKIIVRE